jgi:hypothetical protein
MFEDPPQSIPANLMHIADVSLTFKKAGRNVSGLATVTFVDADGRAVAGVLVSGHRSGGATDTDSGITDTSGMVTLAVVPRSGANEGRGGG